ncbi:MAG: hypothetical protein ACXVQJ_02935 [Actinomycetota bacterium]
MGMNPWPAENPVLHARAAAREHDVEDKLREEGRGEDAPPLPEHKDTSWRYRKDGVPKTFALAGVAVGFVLLIVPGTLALRSYRRWQDGVRPEPTLAWSIAALAVVTPVVVGAFAVLPSIGILVGCLAVPSALWLVRPSS